MHTWGSEWTEWPVYNLPIALMFLRHLFENKWWFYFFFSLSLTMLADATEAISNSSVILWVFRMNTNLYISKCGSAGVHSCKILNSRTQLNIVVLTTLWPQNSFLVCISSFSSLVLHCCRSAERIWNIYQGIVCWRHNFYMVMLLASQITVCSGEQNNPSLEHFFLCFQKRCCIKMHLFYQPLPSDEYGLFECTPLHQTDFSSASELTNVSLQAGAHVERYFFSTSVYVETYFRIPSTLFNYLTIDGCLPCRRDVRLPFLTVQHQLQTALHLIAYLFWLACSSV